MQRRRRLRITPTPVREIPAPDDPGLPDVAPRPEPDKPPPAPPEPEQPSEAPDLPAPVPPRKPRDCLGVTWSEPHLWAAMRAQVDAGRRRRAAHLAARPRSRPCFAPDPPA